MAKSSGVRLHPPVPASGVLQPRRSGVLQPRQSISGQIIAWEFVLPSVHAGTIIDTDRLDADPTVAPALGQLEIRRVVEDSRPASARTHRHRLRDRLPVAVESYFYSAAMRSGALDGDTRDLAAGFRPLHSMWEQHVLR